MRRFDVQSFPMPYEYELLMAELAERDIAGGARVTGPMLDWIEDLSRQYDKVVRHGLLYGFSPVKTTWAQR